MLGLGEVPIGGQLLLLQLMLGLELFLEKSLLASASVASCDAWPGEGSAHGQPLLLQVMLGLELFLWKFLLADSLCCFKRCWAWNYSLRISFGWTAPFASSDAGPGIILSIICLSTNFTDLDSVIQCFQDY